MTYNVSLEKGSFLLYKANNFSLGLGYARGNIGSIHWILYMG